jgi:hypothetical protein
MSKVLFECQAAATTLEGSRIRLSLNWASAQWSTLIIYEHEICFGDWIIPYSEIDDAVLVTLPLGGFGEQRRLILFWRGQHYQFVLPTVSFWPWQSPPASFWDGPLPFAIRRDVGSLEFRSILILFVVFILVIALPVAWLLGLI